MNNKPMNLNLFGEDGSCAAEQTAVGEETATAQNETQTVSGEEGYSTEPEKGRDAVKRIARLLSCEGEDEEAIVRAVNARRARAALSERLRMRSAQNEYKALASEAERLSSKIEGFDLRTELANESFRAMLHSGMSVEDAWKAVHLDALLEKERNNARNEALRQMMLELGKHKDRPEENGAQGKAPANSRTSVDSLTGRGIRDILRRVEGGAKIKF